MGERGYSLRAVQSSKGREIAKGPGYQTKAQAGPANSLADAGERSNVPAKLFAR